MSRCPQRLSAVLVAVALLLVQVAPAAAATSQDLENKGDTNIVADALLLRPEYEEAKLRLARLYLERGEGRAALKLYRQILVQNPGNVEASAAVKELAEYDGAPSDGITGRIGNIFGRLRRDK